MATGSQPSSAGQKRPRQHSKLPSEWNLEFPTAGATDNSAFGGCRRIEDAYDRLVELGQGTYGEVFKARDKATGQQVAIKKIKMENEKEGFPITAVREIKILARLAVCEEKLNNELMRDNIIKLREIVRSDSHESNRGKGSVYMVFDYMEHDMSGLLERANQQKAAEAKLHGRKPDPPFAEGQAKRYMKQLFLGLSLLQANRILHRDLKNANLLVSNVGELKIADFGLARTYIPKEDLRAKKSAPGAVANEDGIKPDQKHQGTQMTNRVITLWYRPPELCLGAEYYGAEVDMWSAGCIMVEMLTGKALFPGTNEVDQVQQIFSMLGGPTEESMPGCRDWKDFKKIVDALPSNVAFPQVSRLRGQLQARGIKDRHALDLLEKLLALNPGNRMTASEAASHVWFSAEPKMYTFAEMPKYAESHELTMRNKRAAEKVKHQHRAAPMPQGHPGGVGGGARRPVVPHGGAGGGGYGYRPQGQGGAPAPRHGSQQSNPPSWQQERR